LENNVARRRVLILPRAIPTTETLRVMILRSSESTLDLYERRSVGPAQSSDRLAPVRGRGH
jgi:hypothetical protein